MQETTVRVAVVQAGSVPFDTEACADKAARLIGELAASGVKAILLPEAFIVGYPKGLNFGLVVGARDALDVADHYSRPDVVQLNVNEAPMRAVVSKPEE